MFRNDYVMRMIEQFGNALGVMLGLKRELKPQEALELLEQTYKRLFGLNPNLIRALSERDLTDLLNRQGEATAEKMLVIAGLMKEEASLSAMLDRPDAGRRLGLKSLNLTLMAARDNTAVPWLDIRGQVEELLELLSGYALPAATQEMLWDYYDSTGRYAEAEDVLFELLDEAGERNEAEQNTRARLLKRAAQFYERLLTVDEETLEAGRLPLDEVRDGLEEVRALAASAGVDIDGEDAAGERDAAAAENDDSGKVPGSPQL